MAFYTIFATPGLSEKDYRRARRSGPNHLSTRGIEHKELLASAGLSLVEERDLTRQFLRTAIGWYETRKTYERGLRQADGDAYYEERQHDAIVQIRAIEDGLLRRALFVAERSRGLQSMALAFHPGPAEVIT
ncbi:MAG TPA: hypothetical protein VFP63_07100 [Dehalococcoidia bacterium]|nr:hypothetical protein [Dehalococcoidia bacterium]